MRNVATLKNIYTCLINQYYCPHRRWHVLPGVIKKV